MIIICYLASLRNSWAFFFSWHATALFGTSFVVHCYIFFGLCYRILLCALTIFVFIGLLIGRPLLDMGLSQHSPCSTANVSHVQPIQQFIHHEGTAMIYAKIDKTCLKE